MLRVFNIIIIFLVAVYFIFKPRLEKTKEGHILLFFNKTFFRYNKKRQYIILYYNKKRFY